MLEMKYFVLKPKGKDAYAKASRQAMLAYAMHISLTDIELEKKLVDWALREEAACEEKP